MFGEVGEGGWLTVGPWKSNYITSFEMYPREIYLTIKWFEFRVFTFSKYWL